MLCTKQQCTGCGACAAACPQNAITLAASGGFFYPIVNKKMCTSCGLCTRACPVLDYPYGNLAPVIYEAVHKDEAQRAASTSGGVFPALAAHVLEEGGLVCASVMERDFFVRMRLSDDPTQIEAMRGTKYVQGQTGDSFRQIKAQLEAGRKVLFVGLPCQVAGLKKFLGKPCFSLLTVDLICHGAPSPLVFSDYIKNLPEPVCAVDFRDKSAGWKHPIFTLRYASGRVDKTPLFKNEFGRAFGASLLARESCSSCPFAKVPRVGDITLGDFWGIETVNPAPEALSKGVSLLAVNSIKGADALRHSLPLIQVERREPDIVSAYNPRFESPAAKNPQRDAFFALYEKRGYTAVYKKYLRVSLWRKLLRKLSGR